MSFRCKGGVAWVALLVAVAALASAAQGFPNPFGHEDFTESYYDETCPNAQSIVRSVMERHAAANPRTAPAILRLFFHDCFVNVSTPISRSYEEATIRSITNAFV
jgi:peroxidase